jgi:dUTP pyrophosphatase
MLLSNCVGVIDSDYRGEITAVFIGVDNELCYNVGDRICQLVIMPYPEIEFVEADELSETERGAGGYGSTGK